jgi:hypothetical protein
MMKHRFHRTLVAASLFAAGCIGAGSALAVTPGAASSDMPKERAPSASMQQGNNYGNAADANKVAPSREQVQREAAMPDSRTLDSNAQRQHDPDNAVRSGADSSSATGSSGMAAGQANDGTISQRDWNKVDTNGDNLISPQEMSTWLQQHGSSSGSAPTTTQQPSR